MRRQSVLLLVVLIVVSNYALADIAGPDSYGYIAIDTVPFSFEDISSTGFARNLGGGGAAVLRSEDGWLPEGFTFPCYGKTYSEIIVGVDGYISFISTVNTTNVDLTLSPTSPNVPVINVLADCWKFRLAGGGDLLYHEVRGEAGSQRFIVQWNEASSSTREDTVTFQAVLYQDSGNILFQYLDVQSGDAHSFGGLASIGIRDTDGHLNGRSLQYSMHTPVIEDGQAILFTVVPLPSAVLLGMLGLGYAGIRLRRHG